MIRATTFAGKHVAVFGLGGSGIATARALAAGGATVAAWDDGEKSRGAARDAGIPLVDLAAADWTGFAALVLAPGVALTHPEPHWSVLAARRAGVEIIGDVEIFCRERAASAPAAPFVAITGTNGKSTTTALIAHLLRAAGCDVQMGGNIGRPILDLEPPDARRVHVVEMSSFQIDLCPSLAPSVGLLLNVSADHLDRHGPASDAALALRNYAAIKERLVAGAGIALVGIDDAISRDVWRRLAERGHAGAIPVSIGAEPPEGGYGLAGTGVGFKPAGAAFEVLADITGIGTLRGRHNAQNALFAVAATRHIGLTPAQAAAVPGALATYPGLPHRMEEVGRAGRVLFINDSKATNADSTEKALAAWSGDIFWILGGKPKEGGIETLTAYFPRIAKAYLIGQASTAFAETLRGKVAFEACGTIDAATAAAARDASASPAAEPVVLLSPACASYDQFRNFEERGDTFRRLVQGLPGVVARVETAP